MLITKQTTMGEMLEYDMGIAYVLMQAGMHCVGCPSSIGESLEEACMVHGLNADEVLADIHADHFGERQSRFFVGDSRMPPGCGWRRAFGRIPSPGRPH